MQSPLPSISVVVPTHNRAASLPGTIQSLTQQTLGANQFEILVVDNASTDETRRVVCEEFCWVSNLIYVHEPQLGLSNARNAGWKNATARDVAYLDDDATARG